MSTSVTVRRTARDREIAGFFSDLVDGLRMSDLWRTFAWDEIQQRYRRSLLGVAWIVIAYAMFVGGVSIFFRPSRARTGRFS